MIIGKMDKRITLQKPNIIPDDAGGYKPGPGGKWLDVATVWAEFKVPKFSTAEVTGGVSSVALLEIKIWFRPAAVKGWRILYGTEILAVDHVYHICRSETFLVCKEVVK